MYFVTRATPIDDIKDKSHKIELKSSRNNIIQPIILNQNYATSYLWSRGRTHVYIHIHMKETLRNQVHAGSGPVRAWFKK